MRQRAIKAYDIFSGLSSEKRASGALLASGKGKTVIAGAHVPAGVARSCLHATPSQLVSVWHRAAVGHLLAGAVGCNAGPTCSVESQSIKGNP